VALLRAKHHRPAGFNLFSVLRSNRGHPLISFCSITKVKSVVCTLSFSPVILGYLH
jgi:hypothetical protein